MMPCDPALDAASVCLLDPGSFRDRRGRVYHVEGRVFRGLNAAAYDAWKALERTAVFPRSVAAGKIIPTCEIENNHITSEGWAAVLGHEAIPFVSYPSEWCFGMLHDAALLQLELMDAALDEDMILQDASPFNVQWRGARPVFIDVPSFVPLSPGQPWFGYRQFCEQFLYPLMLQAYKGVPFQPWLRGSLEGIAAAEFRRFMSWRDLLRPGVLLNVCLQARLQARYAGTNRNLKSELRDAGFGKELIRANVRRLRRLVSGLAPKPAASRWLDYERDATYDRQDRGRKEAFVRQAVGSQRWSLVWDLGCNTGRFSRIAAENAENVVALDADHAAVERLYLQLKEEGCRGILPLVGDLADLSPNRGWRGAERKAFTERGQPDLVLCLALIHHLVLGVGIPLGEVVEWLADHCQHLVIEFVTRDDPMVVRLLRNKDEQYSDYSLPFFEESFRRRFELLRREVLGSGTRILYHGRTRRGSR